MQRKRKTLRDPDQTPNAFNIGQKLRKATEPLFMDEQDALYCFLSKDHAMYKQWQQAGQIDDSTTFAMAIKLSPLIRRDPSTYGRTFPQLGSIVTLRQITDKEIVGEYEVAAYPEHIKPRARSTAVILNKL